MSVKSRILLWLSAMLLPGALAASATAAPVLDMSMTRTTAPVFHSDERLAFEVTVANTGSPAPIVGSALQCQTSVGGKPTGVLSYQWLRDGKPIEGAQSASYVINSADEGKSLQCKVTGTNDPDDILGTGNAYEPVASARVSLPPTVVAPSPSPAPPKGGSGPGFTPVIAGATPVATATVTKDSNLITNVITAKGSGNLVEGSKVVTNLTTTTGAFIAGETGGPQQAISGTGIPGPAAGTGVIAPKPSGTTNVITEVTTSSGAFVVGQEIRGPSIPREIFITAVGPNTLEISNDIAGVDGPVKLYAYTRVLKAGTDTLELSVPATASGLQEFSAGALPFGFGQKITGNGISPGTTVTEITGDTIELSAPATASGTSVTLAGTVEYTCTAPSDWSGTGLTWSFRWLRNAEPIPGATTATYTVQTDDTEPPSFLQCEATAKDSLGREAVAISFGFGTRPLPPRPYDLPTVSLTTVPPPNTTDAPVVVEADLPVGTQALRAGGNDWACVKTPASPPQLSTIKCSRADGLPPGISYPPLTLIARVEPDAPDTLVTKVCASGGGAAELPCKEDMVSGILPAIPFGFRVFETEVVDGQGNDFTQAGGHAFRAGGHIEFNDHIRAEESAEVGLRAVTGFVRDLRTELPPGVVGNPEALGGQCASVSDVIAVPSTCPAASVVGAIGVDLSQGTFMTPPLPLYALEPEPGTPAQLAFGVASVGSGFAYTLTPELRPKDDYAITLVAAPIQKFPELYEAKATICAFGAKLVTHGNGETRFGGCRKAGEAGALDRPFVSLPTRCGDEASTTTRILGDTWEEPGKYAEASFTAPALTGCAGLEFEPTLKARPTTNAADSPSGLDVTLEVPQNEDPEGTAAAHLRETVIELPEGMTINPAAANGLGACTPTQIGLGNNEAPRCPDSSKIGNVTAHTPVLDGDLPGTLYIASPHDNPFGSLLALYLVIDDPVRGITVKLAGKAEADPRTGQITTTFDDNPQTPVDKVQVELRSGAGAPLRTPPTCKTYRTESEVTPWSAPDSGPPVSLKDVWQIRRSASGGACTASPSLEPQLKAGLASPIAATPSAFGLRLTREDGTEIFRTVTATLPRGLLGYLGGVAQCSDAALSVAASKTGVEEQTSPSCPAGSEVGSVSAGAGAGPQPYYAHGKAYLAGPYKGAPLSMAVITPAVAGPFDLGTVIVRIALRVNPETAQVTAEADPLPTILQGIPLDIRDVRVNIDRPRFILAPTSCDPSAVNVQVGGENGESVDLVSRFQLAECLRLPFKPKLSLRLFGKVNRGAHPAFRATLTMPPGSANIASAQVALPPSEFIENAHFQTICTRVQFAANQCPAGSVYGRVRAFSPLVDYPLEGPVYLRSSSHQLPDLVMALRGPAHQPIEVNAVARIDSVNGGIRSTFESTPDAPVSKLVLKMAGGKKGLFVNSRNVCKTKNRATAKFTAHNGKALELQPLLQAQCGKAKRAKGKKRRGAR